MHAPVSDSRLQPLRWLRWILLGLAAFAGVHLRAFEDGARLAWDFSTAAPVTSGVYARVTPLRDGSWLLAYSDGPGVYVRSSTDGAGTFSAPRLVASPAGYNSTNAEVIQLANGWVLLAYNARPTSANEGTLPYQIRTIVSRDLGQTWGDEAIAYSGGKTNDVGCWEPALLQPAAGEVQLFFSNEAPYPTTNEQEIALLRSGDNGLTWHGYTRTSFRPGYRDGMPVPLALHDGTTLVYSIEDNGLVPGNFKPAIIASTDNWTGGTVGAASPQRWGALRSDVAPGATVYAGAPYLTRFGGGETVLSVQSTEQRAGTDLTYAAPRVYLGGADARDFARPSTPLPWLPATASGLWNSVTALADDTVALVSSVSGVATPFGAHAIWLVRAHVLRPIDLPQATGTVDGVASPGEWRADPAQTAPLFIGATSATALSGYLQWDAANLYVRFDVRDRNVATAGAGAAPGTADAVELYLDPTNQGGASLGPGLYRLTLGAGGDATLAATGNGSTWSGSNASGVVARSVVTGTPNNAADSDVGYTIEAAIPWSALGGRPATDAGWGIHVRLDDAGGGTSSQEDLGGDDPARPATWLRATLRAPQPPAITAAPLSRTIAAGGTVTFAVAATGDTPLAFQWFKDGQLLPNATASQLTLSSIAAADVGSYSVQVTNAAGSVTSAPAVLALGAGDASRLANLSTRGAVLTAPSVQIAGFVISGTGPRTLLIRGIGPGLAQRFPSLFSWPDILGDPQLTLYSGSTPLQANDDWSNQPQADVIAALSSQVGAFPLSTGSRDAALLVSLNPGAYTVQLSGNASTGIGLIEVYDLDAAGSSRLVNLSTRGPLGAGNAIMIPGIVVSGGTRTLLIRGVGPGLASAFPGYFSADAVAPDPQVRLVAADGTEVARNDDWSSSPDAAAVAQAAAQVGAFPLVAGSHDAALLATVGPGNYTALVSDTAGRTGIALVEAYDVPAGASR